MKQAVVVVGMGEMGAVFARGLLRLGHPVYPIVRGMDMAIEAEQIPPPELVLIAVAEGDLPPVLAALPHPWRDRVALLQNELLPRDWEHQGLEHPTIVSVWFEKKPGQEAKVILPSPVYGPRARLLHEALATIGIPSVILQDRDQLVFELVRKNLYILTSNICGLETGGTVGDLWDRHRQLAEAVANELLEIQESLVGAPVDRPGLIRAMVAAFRADPEHRCMGRSALQRLRRTLESADRAGLSVAQLRKLAEAHSGQKGPSPG